MTATQVSGYTDSRGRRVSAYTQGRASGVAVKGKHASASSRLSLAGGVFMLLVATVEVLVQVMSLTAALLTMLTVTLLGAAGWMKRRQVRSTRRRAWRYVTGRGGGRRSKSPASIKAKAEAKKILRDQRWARRDETWGRRKAAAMAAARVGVAKVRAGWSQ